MKTKVIDRGWNDIKKAFRELQGSSYVKVGFLTGGGQLKIQNHSDAKATRKSRVKKGKDSKSDITIADLAAVHEYGSPKNNVPERPAMKQAFDLNHRDFTNFVAKIVRNLNKMKISNKEALNIMGVWFKGKLQKEYRDGSFAPLQESTIRRKKSSKPLIDTGRLRQSVDFEVVE